MPETNPISNVQQHIADLLDQADPNLTKTAGGNEVKGNVVKTAGQLASEIFQSMKNNPREGECGALTIAFRETHGGPQAGVQFKFDRAGNQVIEKDGQTTTAQPLNSPGAEILAETATKGISNTVADWLGERNIQVATQTPCGPK